MNLVKGILGFMGIEDFSSTVLEKTNMLPPEETAKNLEAKYLEIKKAAEKF